LTGVLWRGYHERGESAGYRNGNRLGRLKTAERIVEHAIPQVTGMAAWASEVKWDDYLAFTSRDLAGQPVLYLFLDGVAKRLPIAHRKAIRTTNLLERLFGEERRRTKTIPHAFGERAVLKLMFAALARASQTWRRLVIGAFEPRQIEELSGPGRLIGLF